MHRNHIVILYCVRGIHSNLVTNPELHSSCQAKMKWDRPFMRLAVASLLCMGNGGGIMTVPV